jgi:hypothetical protein
VFLKRFQKYKIPSWFTHPTKKYTETLEKRDQNAKKQGAFVNPLFFQERIVRISSRTIRAVQNAILTGKTMTSLMNALIDRLVPRGRAIAEH